MKKAFMSFRNFNRKFLTKIEATVEKIGEITIQEFKADPLP